MKWFKHLVESADDPDIDDAVAQFGPHGYYFFFRTLEVMAREFNIQTPGENRFTVSWFSGRFRLKLKTIQELSHFFSERKRIHSEFYRDGKIEMIYLNCPKLKELCDEYTKKLVPHISGQTPDNVPIRVGTNSGIELEEEVDKEKRIKETSKKIFEDLKILASKVEKKYEGFNPYEAIQKAVNNGHLVEDIKPALEYMLTNQVDNTWGCFNRITAKEKRLRLENEREQNWEQRKIDDKRKVADLIQGIGK